MSVWDHKAAHELACAVEKHIHRSSAEPQAGHILMGVYSAAKKASKTAETNPVSLMHIWSSLCFACRRDKLYQCDVSEGKSEHCSFLLHND